MSHKNNSLFISANLKSVERQTVSGVAAMSEPTITCPNCKSEIKLTESLAAPLIDATRRQYDQKIARKDAEVAERALSVSPTSIDHPLTRGIETFNANVLENTKRALEFYTAPFTVAAKR